MSELTDVSESSEAASHFQISFREDLPDPEREVAERSVTTLIAQTEERVAKMQARKAERATLRAALNAPLRRIVEQDPEALRTIDDLRDQDFLPPDTIADFDLQPLPVMSGHFTMSFDPYNFPTTVNALALRPRIIDVRVPPYDFTWSFFDQPGGPAFQQRLNNNTGEVALQTRSGSVEGGASGFVRAHAGFGMVFRTEHASMAIGRSFRRMRFAFSMDAIGLNSNATSEGGMDFGAFEDGRLLNVQISTLWHHRMSSDDDAITVKEGPFPVYDPYELAFPTEPGHLYAFPVGIWVFSDREPGIGLAAAISLMQGNVLAISIER